MTQEGERLFSVSLSHTSGGGGEGAAGTRARALLKCDLRRVCVRSADFMKNLFERNKSKNKGLISADRRTKPTLMLTIPHSYKVVYNGFISSNVENCDKIRC